MLTVIASYRAKAGCADRVAAILARHVRETRAEAGCVQFIAYRGVEERDRFVLYEQYDDEDAFAEHRRSEHFRRNVENGIAPLLAERSWKRLEEVSAS